MTMVKKDWGWDRVTLVGAGIKEMTGDGTKEAAEELQPPFDLYLGKAAEEQAPIVSHYPVLQIIDGNGERTKYFEEYMAFMKTVEHPEHLTMSPALSGKAAAKVKAKRKAGIKVAKVLIKSGRRRDSPESQDEAAPAPASPASAPHKPPASAPAPASPASAPYKPPASAPAPASPASAP